MIYNMRKYVRSTGYQLILWITIIALAGLFSLPGLFKKTEGGPWAFKVNGREISYKEFMQEYQDRRDQMLALKAQYGDWIEQVFGNVDPKKMAYDSLTREVLLEELAQDMSVALHKDFVMRQLNNPIFVRRELSSVIPPFAIDERGVINYTILKQYLRRKGISPESFERKLEKVLTERFVMDIINASLYIPKYELKQEYLAQFAGKKFSVMTFKEEDFLKTEKSKTVTDQEVADFFEKENNISKRYWVPEKRSGVVWVFDQGSYNVEITDEAIQNYYEKNKATQYVDAPTQVQVRHILFVVKDEADRAAALEKAEKVRTKLVEDPTQFENLAKSFSDDKTTATKGGLMPFFARGEGEKEIEQAAFALQEDGALSKIIETPKGYEILQRVAKKAQTFKPLSQVQNAIRTQLAEKRFANQFTQKAQEALNSSDRIEKIAVFAEEKKGKKEIINAVENTDDIINKTLFTIKKEDDALVTVDGKKGYIIQLTGIQKSFKPELSTVRSAVVADLYRQRAAVALHNALQEANNMLKEGSSVEEIVKEFGASVFHTGIIHPTETKELQELAKKGLPQHAVRSLTQVGSTLIDDQGINGHLIRLDEIEPFNEKSFAEHKDEIIRAAQSAKMRLLAEAFVASLYRNATIETNQSVNNLQQ